jgi:hypothetical protein
MPALEVPGEHSLAYPQSLIDIGANAVLFGLIVPYESDGVILGDYVAYEWLAASVEAYRGQGLAVGVALEPINVETQGEPGPVPPEVRGVFLAGLGDVVQRVAVVLEETNAEVFAPLNEIDYKLGVEAASEWGQEILPLIRSSFSGRVLWKGSLFEHVGAGAPPDIDFTGYDIVGFSLFPFSGIARYPAMASETIASVRSWASEDGVSEVWAAEFGSYMPVPISRQDEPDAIRIVFDEGSETLGGFFILDPSRGFGTPLRGSDLEAVVLEQFTLASTHPTTTVAP